MLHRVSSRGCTLLTGVRLGSEFSIQFSSLRTGTLDAIKTNMNMELWGARGFCYKASD